MKLILPIIIITLLFLGGKYAKDQWYMGELANRVRVKQVQAQPPKDPTIEEIVDYILFVFKDETPKVKVKALHCFISESQLNPKAVNDSNKNGTTDYNIPQINSIHIKRFGDKFITNWRESIKVGYQIYKERGFGAWYGTGCR